MESPAIQSGEPGAASAIVTESSPAESPEGLDELLIDELREHPSCEKQLTKALPRWPKRALRPAPRIVRATSRGEPETQIERLNECFDLLGKTARAKPARG